MERKIGETFEFENKKIEVKEVEKNICSNCFFNGMCIGKRIDICGECYGKWRSDGKNVIFVEMQEQPQKLNLCEILKYCPHGETFWSPLLGGIKFHDINQKRNFIVISLESGETWDINADGTITFGDVTSPEIMLYPSRTQRDWTKVKYEPKKERFDPKTLKPFDKVLVNHDDIWKVDFFSHICQYEPNGWCQCIGDSYYICIPYNDETKHLLGTKEEAPEFYKYWED